MHLSSRLHRSLCLAAALILGALALMPVEASITQAIRVESLPGDLRRIIGLSEFFAHGFGVFVILMAIWTIAPMYRRRLPRLFACAYLPGLVVLLIKLSVGRYRPGAMDSANPVSGESWIGWFPGLTEESTAVLGYSIQSFPSGHAATAMGLAVGLSWLQPSGRWLFFFCAAMAAAQRVVYKAHWTSDVLIGCAIAIVISAWMTSEGTWADRILSRLESPSPEPKPMISRSKAA